MKLDIGCGVSKRNGYLGLDIRQFPGIDIVHDLNIFPYPFEDNSINEIWLDQVLEHLKEPLKAVEEIHRICKNGAKVNVGVPYFRSFYAVIDPTHRNMLGIHWFDYFDPATIYHQKYRYSESTYSVRKIEFDREYKRKRIGYLHWFMIKFANRYPHYYEVKLSHLYPLNSLTFYLTVTK